MKTIERMIYGLAKDFKVVNFITEISFTNTEGTHCANVSNTLSVPAVRMVANWLDFSPYLQKLEESGPDMKAALAESGIFYCYLDDFYSGNSEDIKKNALFKEMYRWIDNSVHLNVNDMFDAALRNTRIEMSPAERRQFYEKHIRHMTLTIDENGNVSIELKRG
jgi:hypothetical protein